MRATTLSPPTPFQISAFLVFPPIHGLRIFIETRPWLSKHRKGCPKNCRPSATSVDVGTNDCVSGVGRINSYYGNRAPCFSLGKGCRAARSCPWAMLEIGRKQSLSCRGEWVRRGALWSVQQVRRIWAFCYYFTHRNRCGLVDLRLFKECKM